MKQTASSWGLFPGLKPSCSQSWQCVECPFKSKNKNHHMHCGKILNSNFSEMQSHAQPQCQDCSGDLKSITGMGRFLKDGDVGMKRNCKWFELKSVRVTPDLSVIDAKSKQLWYLCEGILWVLQRWEFGKFCEVIFSMEVTRGWAAVWSHWSYARHRRTLFVCVCIWCMWERYPWPCPFKPRVPPLISQTPSLPGKDSPCLPPSSSTKHKHLSWTHVLLVCLSRLLFLGEEDQLGLINTAGSSQIMMPSLL